MDGGTENERGKTVDALLDEFRERKGRLRLR